MAGKKSCLLLVCLVAAAFVATATAANASASSPDVAPAPEVAQAEIAALLSFLFGPKSAFANESLSTPVKTRPPGKKTLRATTHRSGKTTPTTKTKKTVVHTHSKTEHMTVKQQGKTKHNTTKQRGKTKNSTTKQWRKTKPQMITPPGRTKRSNHSSSEGDKEAGHTPSPTLPPTEELIIKKKPFVPRGRCATSSPNATLHAKVEKDLKDFKLVNGSKLTESGTIAIIPVWFHVIYTLPRTGSQPTYANGYVTADRFQAQIDVLNFAYSTAGFTNIGFQFYLAGFDYTQNNAWFYMQPYDGNELAAKTKLHQGLKNMLNIYLCSPGNGALGYSYYPWDTSVPANLWRDGLSILYTTLPGGSYAGYNEGKTVVHESGHWLGLYHTFFETYNTANSSCIGSGDSVSDTNPESQPAFGCPSGRTTCAGQGPDPITNFMDYSYDPCMYQFTVGQANRTAAMWKQYRSGVKTIAPAVTVSSQGPVG